MLHLQVDSCVCVYVTIIDCVGGERRTPKGKMLLLIHNKYISE